MGWNPVDIIANVATGGLYGLGKAGAKVAGGNVKGFADVPLAPVSPVPTPTAGGVIGLPSAVKTPPVPDAAKAPGPTPPSVDDAATRARLAAAEVREKGRRRRAASTILTSPQGVLEAAPTQIKTLLGS